MSTSIMWFRTDLRLGDHPALVAAVEAGSDGVVPLVVIDEHFWGPGASVRQGYLVNLLTEFDERIGGLYVRRGDPTSVVAEVARQVEATSVHVSADFTPYGHERDQHVEAALAKHGVDFVRTGSPYAISPGRITKDDGEPYRVFTPFYKAWLDHGWREPAPEPKEISWLVGDDSDELPDAHAPDGVRLPEPGEAAARSRWSEFLDHDVADYADARNLPGDDRTSRMSAHLKWGTIHPRTMLADLDRAQRPEGLRARAGFPRLLRRRAISSARHRH